AARLVHAAAGLVHDPVHLVQRQLPAGAAVGGVEEVDRPGAQGGGGEAGGGVGAGVALLLLVPWQHPAGAGGVVAGRRPGAVAVVAGAVGGVAAVAAGTLRPAAAEGAERGAPAAQHVRAAVAGLRGGGGDAARRAPTE